MSCVVAWDEEILVFSRILWQECFDQREVNKEMVSTDYKTDCYVVLVAHWQLNLKLGALYMQCWALRCCSNYK